MRRVSSEAMSFPAFCTPPQQRMHKTGNIFHALYGYLDPWTVMKCVKLQLYWPFQDTFELSYEYSVPRNHGLEERTIRSHARPHTNILVRVLSSFGSTVSCTIQITGRRVLQRYFDLTIAHLMCSKSGLTGRSCRRCCCTHGCRHKPPTCGFRTCCSQRYCLRYRR